MIAATQLRLGVNEKLLSKLPLHVTSFWLLSLCSVLNAAVTCGRETRFVECAGPRKTQCRRRLGR